MHQHRCIEGVGKQMVGVPMSWSRTRLSVVNLLPVFLLAGCGNVILYSSLPVQPTGPPPTASQNGTISIAPKYVALGAGQSVQFTATVAGNPPLLWLVNGITGGNASVGTVDAQGNFTAPSSLQVSANAVITAEVAASPQTNFATSVAHVIDTGVVTPTTNPQVADYSIGLPAPGSVTIEFGPTATYGFPTSAQASPANGGTVTTQVAGMLGATLYHMRSRILFADGSSFIDSDHTFTTGQPPATSQVVVTPGLVGTPQPGIELFDTAQPHTPSQAFATNLSGGVIWTYTYQGPTTDLIQPIKQLPNGHFLVQIAYLSSVPFRPGGSVPQGALDEVREVDLVGNTVRSITTAQVASALTAEGYTLNLGSLHHDVLSLPNGHLVLLFTVSKDFSNLPGYPGTTTVLGDLIVDVDQNFKPDWVWNSFDHLDVNRHPYLFPDWTHSNALLYSTDDHNLLLSIRHQNWIIKIAFDDGTGSGNIVWHLGKDGDFKLQNGSDPVDWFYAQHGISYFTPNTTGVFRMGVMDNGDDRFLASGQVDCPIGKPPSANCYSTAQVLEIDESNMTATLLDRYTDQNATGQPVYSFFGGNVSPLPNGDMETDFCSAPGGSIVQELYGAFGSQSVVWQANTPSANQYRTERLPSLYPGVQW